MFSIIYSANKAFNIESPLLSVQYSAQRNVMSNRPIWMPLHYLLGYDFKIFELAIIRFSFLKGTKFGRFDVTYFYSAVDGTSDRDSCDWPRASRGAVRNVPLPEIVIMPAHTAAPAAAVAAAAAATAAAAAAHGGENLARPLAQDLQPQRSHFQK